MKKVIAILGFLAVAVLALLIHPASREEIQWRWVTYKGDTASYESYIETWDEGRHVEEAKMRSAIAISDLIREKKIEVKANGLNIQVVVVKLSKLVPHPLTIRIPVGTYFVSANPSSQNMITTEEIVTRLVTDQSKSLTIDAACANRTKNIPGKNDSFTIQGSPNQEELAKLMPALEKANVEYPVIQAAVWIVTDNANMYDLGLLRSLFGQPLIHSEHMARALKVLDEAGIDIKKKAIWVDRKNITNFTDDVDLKNWLNSKN